MELLLYIHAKLSKKIQKQKLEKYCKDIIIKNKILKKYVNKVTFEWNWNESTVKVREFEDFWNIVNGHVILNLLKFYNQSIASVYSDTNSQRLNRKFELSLIQQYDYNCFYKTNLFNKMREAGLLKRTSSIN